MMFKQIIWLFAGFFCFSEALKCYQCTNMSNGCPDAQNSTTTEEKDCDPGDDVCFQNIVYFPNKTFRSCEKFEDLVEKFKTYEPKLTKGNCETLTTYEQQQENNKGKQMKACVCTEDMCNGPAKEENSTNSAMISGISDRNVLVAMVPMIFGFIILA